MKWISVKERLPEDTDERVLVYDSLHKEITIGTAPSGADGFWGVEESFDYHERCPSGVSAFITYWMPLPDKPIG